MCSSTSCESGVTGERSELSPTSSFATARLQRLGDAAIVQIFTCVEFEVTRKEWGPRREYQALFYLFSMNTPGHTYTAVQALMYTGARGPASCEQIRICNLRGRPLGGGGHRLFHCHSSCSSC